MTVSSGGELVFDDTLRQIRPDIGVVTVIGTDHLSIFGLGGRRRQKGRLIECLPAHGTAVLNADDPLVHDMGRRTRARVITYGEAEDATLRAGDVSARWPERLSFTVHHRARRRVRTGLYGAHLLTNVLAALAVGLAMGIPLAEAVAAVEDVAPVDGRLSPVDHPTGSRSSATGSRRRSGRSAALRFVGEARASRKIVVFGTVSDYAGNSNKAYAGVARQALEVADRVIFVGNNSSRALRARRHEEDEAVQAFYSVEVAAEHLRGELRPGDLVLLKGSLADRLDVIAAEVMRPRDAGRRPPDPGGAGSGGRFQVILGLGNPGAAFDDTPTTSGTASSTSSRAPRRVVDPAEGRDGGASGRRRVDDLPHQAGGADERDRAGRAEDRRANGVLSLGLHPGARRPRPADRDGARADPLQRRRPPRRSLGLPGVPDRRDPARARGRRAAGAGPAGGDSS